MPDGPSCAVRPNVTIRVGEEEYQGDYSHIFELGTPTYTADLAFYIFVGILAVVIVIAILLCVVGHQYLRPEDEVDVSESSEANK